MPRYFFNVHQDGKVQNDDTGCEFANLDDLSAAAFCFLSDIAREQSPQDWECRSVVLLVTDEDERPVYSATLHYAGMSLRRPP